MSDGPDGPAPVTLTLLVCTRNRSRDLRDLLETALAQEAVDSSSYEVLIVDNNSKDDTRRVVETLMMTGHANLRYLFQECPKCDALNAGLEAARGVIVSVVEDDCLLPSDWVKKLVVAFREHPDVSVIGSKGTSDMAGRGAFLAGSRTLVGAGAHRLRRHAFPGRRATQGEVAGTARSWGSMHRPLAASNRSRTSPVSRSAASTMWISSNGSGWPEREAFTCRRS